MERERFNYRSSRGQCPVLRVLLSSGASRSPLRSSFTEPGRVNPSGRSSSPAFLSSCFPLSIWNVPIKLHASVFLWIFRERERDVGKICVGNKSQHLKIRFGRGRDHQKERRAYHCLSLYIVNPAASATFERGENKQCVFASDWRSPHSRAAESPNGFPPSRERERECAKHFPSTCQQAAQRTPPSRNSGKKFGLVFNCLSLSLSQARKHQLKHKRNKKEHAGRRKLLPLQQGICKLCHHSWGGYSSGLRLPSMVVSII